MTADKMKHYFHPMSRAVTTHWMLEELGEPYEQVLIDFPAGANDTPEYRAINPMGKIPALVDNGTVITETAAICAYLADKFPQHNMAPDLQSPQRGHYLRCLFLTGNTLEPMFTFHQFGVTDYPAQSAGFGDMTRCLATIQSLVPTRDWVLGEQFSAADLVFGGTLDFSVQLGWVENPSDEISAYIQRLKARPAYRATHDPSWY